MKIFTTVIFILLTLHCYGQQRTVTGRLTDDSNSPLPGVNVVIKGTGQGTVTDADGRYSIDAQVGSTLVFSFIGMVTKEVLVTRHGLSGIKTRIPSADLNQPDFSLSWTDTPADTTGWSKPGVAIIGRSTGKVLNNSSIDPDEIVRIRKLGNNYFLHTKYPDNSTHALNFQFTTSIGVETVNRWPSLQSTYSQGRPSGGSLHWRGADNGEVFSYGPLVRTLEYDGSSYPYDVNGRLVLKGNGNGKAASAYDPLDFFNSILVATTQLSGSIRLQNQSALSVSYEKTDRGGIIPGSWASLDNLTMLLKDFKVSKDLKVSAFTNMQISAGKLLPHGSNLSNIIYSVYRTPPTFNNANKLSSAPGLADSPYDLSSNLPDEDRGRRSTSSLIFTYDIGELITLNVSSNFDYQSVRVVTGFVPGGASMPNGRITERNTSRGYFNSIASLNYRQSKDNWEHTGRITYYINHQGDNISRQDRFGFTRDSFLENGEADSSLSTINRLTRTTHELHLQAGFSKYDHLTVKFANRAYFSNTAPRHSYLNFFPSASIEYNLGDELYIERLAPYVMASRNIKEAPLLWSSWSHVSTQQSVQSAMSVYESGELFFSNQLSPETDFKFETGVKSDFGQLRIELGYYNTTTKNFIAPVLQNNQMTLTNAARVNTSGWLAFISRSFYIYPDFEMHVGLNWSKYNSVVRELNTSTDFVRLAGFTEVAAVLAKGQPVGAIYGTSYLHDDNGRLTIDSQGFPIVDQRVKMIGNPIPKWTGGTTISVAHRQRFKLWTVLDYRHGGDRWNGTNRVLDYLGMSQTTADQRTIANYVFEGHDLTGTPNVLPVSFADAAADVGSNRWVRDGYAGAAEEYIEDSSWMRMSELGLSFSTSTSGSAFMKWIQVSVWAKNVFLLTKYHGSDPSTPLFGYANGSGIDFFNLPGVKGFHASVSIKF